MLIKLPSFVNFLLVIVISSLVVVYYSIFNIRLAILPVLILLVLCFQGRGRILYSLDMLVFFLLLLYIFICSIFIDDYSVFMAIFTFMLFLYWPNFIGDKCRKKISINCLAKAYITAALICSIGVLVQSYMYSSFGVEFGKIDFYYQRTGFGFLWLDYSFLSLFLVSSIPLLIYVKSNTFKSILISILFIAALTTSARTGVFSLLSSCLIFVCIHFLRAVYSGKIKAIWLVFFIIGIVSIIFLPIIWGLISDRELTTSGSGRFEGYFEAIEVYLNSPWFGEMYNTDHYKENFGVIPHNVFIYMLVMGGTLGGGLFCVWLFLIYKKAIKTSVIFKFSLMTIFLGIQFIPSFFSGYFIAILLSLVLFERIEKSN